MPQWNISDFAKNGILYFDKSDEFRADCGRARKAWMNFCALPLEWKRRCHYTRDHLSSGNGYEYKPGEDLSAPEPIFDAKENFHMRASAREWLLEEAHRVDLEVAPEFIISGLALARRIREVVLPFVEAYAEFYGDSTFAEDVMADEDNWLLRFLHYFGVQKLGEVIAKAHPDKGLFSMPMDETDGGVEQLPSADRVWMPMKVSAERGAIFGGLGLQYHSGSQVRALAHQVVATERTAREGRFATVAFMSRRNQWFFDKNAFGSQQKLVLDHGPDWFYNMPHGEFATLFVQK